MGRVAGQLKVSEGNKNRACGESKGKYYMSKSKRMPSHQDENLKQHAKALVSATSHIAEGKVSEARNKLSELLDTAADAVEDA